MMTEKLALHLGSDKTQAEQSIGDGLFIRHVVGGDGPAILLYRKGDQSPSNQEVIAVQNALKSLLAQKQGGAWAVTRSAPRVGHITCRGQKMAVHGYRLTWRVDENVGQAVPLFDEGEKRPNQYRQD